MTTIRFAVPVLALAALLTPAAAGHARAPQAAAAAVPAATPWGRAFELPGLGTSTAGGFSQVESVSCGSAGNCAAGGFYQDPSGHLQGFVVSQRRGVWRRAFEVPGLGTLNTGGDADVWSVSCASAGNCAAGGNYTDRHGHNQGFVVSQRNGVWRRAIEIPGLAALNTGGNAQVGSASCGSAGNCGAGGNYSMSCGSAGNCAAGGNYTDGHGHVQGFVVSQRNGVWRRAFQVPGLRALNTGGNAGVSSMSCASAGNCVAGGDYFPAPSSHTSHGFVVSQRNGVWRRAFQVPGLRALSAGGSARVWSVSCASAGNCAAGGFAAGRGFTPGRGFVVSQRNGVWPRAIEVPGLDALAPDGAQVFSVSCGSAGNCLADGSYQAASAAELVFVVSERNGVWHRAFDVPGLDALSSMRAGVGPVSCASAGNCAVGGTFDSGLVQGFVVSQRNGVWRRAIEVPGLRALNVDGDAGVSSVSCGSAGNCAAGGSYTSSGNFHGFVVSQRNGVWRQAIEVPGLSALEGVRVR